MKSVGFLLLATHRNLPIGSGHDYPKPLITVILRPEAVCLLVWWGVGYGRLF